ncbi:MAG: chondroitinase-B domain-containing protein [Pseudomonadota bacterium]
MRSSLLAIAKSRPQCIDTSGLSSIEVSNQGELNAALAEISCGTAVVLGAGEYNGDIDLNRSCGPADPLVLQNAPDARPILNGKITLRGSHIYVTGMRINSGVRINGDSHRLSRNVMQGQGSGSLVIRSNGTNMTIDHNEIFDHGQGIRVCSTGSCGGGEANRGTYIGYNYFHDQKGQRKNANENITTHGDAWGKSEITIENNLIVNAGLDDEAISIKTSNNVVRGNTIINSRGLVVRLGSNNLLEGNVIINGKGIRVHGDNNILDNNLIEDRVGIRIAEGSITQDDRNPECKTGDIQPIKLLADGQCVKGHPAARNTVLMNNYADINLGCLSRKPSYNVPAQGTLMFNNDGYVGQCLDAGTTDAGGRPSKPAPRALEPADVGPDAGIEACRPS